MNDHQGLALNEVFVGPLYSMEMASYELMLNTDHYKEYQKSSGLVAALREGASGWLNNICGAKPFLDERIQFIVREPKNRGRNYRLVNGFTDSLTIIARSYGLIVSLDGNKDKFMYKLDNGEEVRITISNKPLSLIVIKNLKYH